MRHTLACFFLYSCFFGTLQFHSGHPSKVDHRCVVRERTFLTNCVVWRKHISSNTLRSRSTFSWQISHHYNTLFYLSLSLVTLWLLSSISPLTRKETRRWTYLQVKCHAPQSQKYQNQSKLTFISTEGKTSGSAQLSLYQQPGCKLCSVPPNHLP